MGKKTFIIVIILPLLIFNPFFLFTTEGKKENAGDKITELKYYKGKIFAESVPYNERFAIVGSTQLPDGNADLVELSVRLLPTKKVKKIIKQIRRLKRRRDRFPKKAELEALNKGICKLEKCLMEMGEEIETVEDECKNSPTFRLEVQPLVTWKGFYRLDFTFYEKFNKNHPIIKDIVKATHQELSRIFEEKKEVSASEVAKKLKTILVSKIQEEYQGKTIKRLTPRKKEPGYQPGIFTLELIKSPIVNKISNVSKMLPIRIEQIKMEKQTITAVINDTRASNQYDDLIKELFRALEDCSHEEGFPYTEKDLIGLKLAVRIFKKETDPEKIFDKLKNLDNKTLYDKFKKTSSHKCVRLKKILSSKSKSSLYDILQLMLSIYGWKIMKEENQRDIEELESGLEKLLTAHFIENYHVSIPVRTYPLPSELDRVLIGTAYGFGGVFLLSGNADMEFDAFSFIGLKFYLGPVDRRRPNPFLTKGSRWAITLGSVFNSGITFKGQVQENALGGIIPILGLSYDLHRFFAVNLGAVFFRQPSINPLAAETKKYLKIALYCGISFDLDVINKIKTLVSPGK